MPEWRHGDPDRRSHSNPGLSADVGELRGVLQQHLTQQMQLWARYHDELRDQRERHEAHLKEINTRLEAVIGWKNEMTGGMRVGVLIWRAWAGAVTLYIAWQGYIKSALAGKP